MAEIIHTLEYYCERYIEKPTCARYDALAEKVVNTRVTRCSECKYFYPFFNQHYGKCSRRHLDDEVVKTADYCSYAVPKDLPVPEYDDHEVSGLLDD